MDTDSNLVSIIDQSIIDVVDLFINLVNHESNLHPMNHQLIKNQINNQLINNQLNNNQLINNQLTNNQLTNNQLINAISDSINRSYSDSYGNMYHPAMNGINNRNLYHSAMCEMYQQSRTVGGVGGMGGVSGMEERLDDAINILKTHAESAGKQQQQQHYTQLDCHVVSNCNFYTSPSLDFKIFILSPMFRLVFIPSCSPLSLLPFQNI